MSVKPSRVVAVLFLYSGLLCFSYIAVADTVNQRVTVPKVESNTNNGTNNNNNENGSNQNNENDNSNTNESTNENSNVNTNEANENINTPIDSNTNVGVNTNTNNSNTPNTNESTNENSNVNTNEANENGNLNANENINQNNNTPPSNTNLNTNTKDPEQPAGQIPSIGDLIDSIQDSAAAFIEEHPTLQQTSEFVQSGSGKALTTSAGVTGVVSWVALAASQAAGATVTVTSFADITAIVIRFFGALFGLSRRRRQPWGTVYDAVTKRPLDPAYVLAQTDTGKEVKESFTDLDGRYGFLLPPGTYLVTAQKTHYAFPSKKLAGRTRDELYDNLYFGEFITAQGDEVITRNIPLDPVDFDWNEFEKNQENQFRFYSQRRKIFYTITLIIYIVGFVATVISALLHPGILNIISLILYIVILLYHLFWLPKRRAVTVQYASGRPLPFSIVRLYSARLKKEVKSVVTDEHGRFYVLLEPSRYYITVEAKQPDGGYKLVYQSEVMELKKGVMPHSIVIPPTNQPAP